MRELMRPLGMFDRKPAGSGRPAVKPGRIRFEELWTRPPKVFVRDLALHEGQRLKLLSKQSKLAPRGSGSDPAGLEHADERARSPSVLVTDESHVRNVIHDFNERGWSRCALVKGGRPRRIQTDDEQRIVAGRRRSRPDTLGVPYTR